MLSKTDINTRLIYLVAALVGWDNRGEVGRKLGIQKSRWTRILRHKEKLHDVEVVAIKNYFHSHYDWILEGKNHKEYEQGIRELFEYLSVNLSPKERLDLMELIQKQGR